MSRDEIFNGYNAFDAPSGPTRAELEARLAKLYSETDKRFHVLVRAAGLKPADDFHDRDLRMLDLHDAELEGFDFTGSDLRGTGLRFAKLGHSTKLDNVLIDDEDANWINLHEFNEPYWDQDLYIDLIRAIAAGQIEIAYQPILSVREAMVQRVEALARWRHPTRGAIAAHNFIPMLEELGGIDNLGHLLLEKVVEDQGRLRELGVSIGISINISASSIAKRAFREDCMRILVGKKADIRFDISETQIAIHGEDFQDSLRMLRPLGISVAIDDYGTSYSSFSEVRHIGAQEMKIDPSFIRNVTEGGQDVHIVRSVIDLGHSFGMTVTAKGIETNGQAYASKAMGCDDLQGYWVQRPLPFDDLVAFLHVSTISGWSQKLQTLQPPGDGPV
ncbi:MAG: EAL domain-containing protein [Sphingomonas parapaucimobilis]